MLHHRVRLSPKEFKAVKENEKFSVVIPNDRNFNINDAITFYNVVNRDTVSARISYLDDYGCFFGYINISFKDVNLLVVTGD